MEPTDFLITVAKNVLKNIDMGEFVVHTEQK
jgi:hypothetical protein